MVIDLAILADSYSVVGTKKCHFSDQKNDVFQFSDSGGIFGDKKDYRLTDNEFFSQANPIVITSGLGDTSGQVICKVSFRDGSVVFACDKVAGFLTALSKLYTRDKYPSIYVPAILREADAGRFLETFDTAKNPSILETLDFASAALITTDLSKNFALPIAITRVGDRIRLSTLYLEDCELPVDALPIRIAENKVICTKRLLLGGVQVSGFTIYFPGSSFAIEYVQRLGLVQLDASAEPSTKVKSQDGLTSQVRVRGILAGDAVGFSECDADLTANGLTLLSPIANTPRVHFDFTSPDLAIDGTSDSFLISDSNGTTLQISATSDTFHRAILDNHVLRSAAHRAANSGPFVACSPTGDPIRLEEKQDCLKIFKDGAPNVLLTTSANLPNLEWQDSEPLLRIGDLSLSAQLPMLEGISAATLTSALIEKVRTDFHGCVSTLVGLEGKYFAYCVLGKLTESHLSITSAVAMQASAQVTSMVSAYEQNVFLAFIVQNAALLARDLETTANYLPAFAVDRDSDILDRVGISNALNARNVEQAYQRALGPIGSLTSHLYRLDGYTSRLTSMRKALAQDEGWGKFLPLGVSAAASLVNPFALVGVAQQGVSLLSRTESRATVEQDAFNDAFESGSKEWDYIIHSLLPSVSYRLCQEIYPIRLNTSALLLSAYDKADQTARGSIEYFVAQRFARLSAFLDFPSGLDKNLSRSQVIEFLFQLQKYAEAFGLRHF